MRLLFFIVASFILQSVLAQSLDEKISILDKYIEAGRQQWSIPGLSVSIVKDGKTLLSKGYGETLLGSNKRVDDKTLFSIGSTTKAIVAAAMAMLVDEGKVKWSDKVIDHLPEFRLYDSYATRELRIQDLFTHNSGVGNADLLWSLWGYSTEEVVNRMQYLEPRYGFRGGYTYQNIMYATAGLVIERITGTSWNDFIHDRVFKPIGMDRSFALKSMVEADPNRTRPHYKISSGIIEITDSNADSIGAAGSIWSCSTDMAKWMMFVLDSARVNGQRLISAENYAVLHQAKIVIPKNQFYPTAQLTKPNFTTYSLGWFQHDYMGHYVQFHTGSLNGAIAIIGLVPEENLGVYFLGNLDHAELRHAIMYKTIDVMLDLPSQDWSTEFKELYEKFDKDSDSRLAEREAKRHRDTKSTLALDAYAGIYSNQYLGEITIYVVGGKLEAQVRSDRHLKFEHWHYDSFLMKIKEYEAFDNGSLVDFHVDSQLNISLSLWGDDFRKNK